LFYPDQPRALRATVDELVAAAEPAQTTPDLLKVLIVPHAGYVYSGPVAATAYALLKAHRQRIRRVIVLGPTHRVAIRASRFRKRMRLQRRLVRLNSIALCCAARALAACRAQ